MGTAHPTHDHPFMESGLEGWMGWRGIGPLQYPLSDKEAAAVFTLALGACVFGSYLYPFNHLNVL